LFDHQLLSLLQHLEELFLPCAKVIETCNLATVVMFAEDIQQEESPSTSKPIAMALQNTVCARFSFIA